MNPPLSSAYLKALCCPSCKSSNLLLTKEKIIVCQSCLNGYRLMGDVPDFRLENAISFKKKLNNMKKGLNAIITVLMGDNKNQSVDVKAGHCVVMGRRIDKEQDLDVTIVGKPKPTSYVNLDPGNRQLIERFMSQNKVQQPKIKRESTFDVHQKVLGSYTRDPDFLLNDPSVSRSHAVVYQDDRGVHLLDLVSKNGTYINGYEVETSRLKNNDVISLGTASLRVNLY